MAFDELLTQVHDLLQRQGRLSYRALKARFQLDDDLLDALKDELIYAQRVAADEDGRVLVWTGATAAAPAAGRATAQERTPLSYTPKHLADKILTTRSALEGERKHVTVLFADVAGFSPLAERLEPDDLHQIMDGCFAILTDTVHHYEGTINQYTGDGIMALFGAPITHEDHAVRALHAALDIQAALRDYGATVQRQWGVPFQLRLGLNTGVVVVGRIGDDLRMDYTAQGDTVNLAARLQQQAPPGAIWVAEATYRLASATFVWKDLGALPIRGRSQPVTSYELRGRQTSRSRFDAAVRQGLTRFVGRDPELQRLLEAWAQAQQGHGQVVSVVGEAGFGKSRLLYEFKQHLAQTSARCLEGTCFTYGESISYLPFLDIVRACCGLKEVTGEPDAKRHLATHLTTLALDPLAVAPYLHNLLSFAVDDAVFPTLTPELVRQRTVAALKALVGAEARQQPLVLLLEDVHWIDKATEEVVGAVLEAIAALPLLLVLVYRPEYVHAWASRAYHAQITLSGLRQTGGVEMVRAILSKPYASQVALAPLDPAQRTAMVQDILGTETLPPEVEQLIVTKTEGNPLFIEELIRSLLESGVLAQTQEGYRLTQPVETLTLPTTVQGVLLARIDRLHEELKEVLQVAAVIGRVFSAPVLAQVVHRGVALEQTLGELADLEFIYPTSLAPQREYSFKHVLTQEAVYSTLLRARREVYHECIGAAMETLYADRLDEYYEVLAYHYTRSANADKAVAYLDLANQKAAKANAMAEAKGYFDHAMQLLDTLPDTTTNRQRRLALLVQQGVVMILLLQLSEYDALLSRYETIAVELGQAELLGPFYARRGLCAWWFGNFDDAIQDLPKAVELCSTAGRFEDAGQAYVHWQWSHLLKGDYARVLALKEDLLRAMEHQLNLRWYTFGLSGACLAYTWLGRWDEAVEEGQKALHMGEAYADPSIISFGAQILSFAYTAKGDVAQGVAFGELAVQQAPTPADAAWSRCYLAWAYCRAGAPHRWLDELAQLIAQHRAARFIWSEIYALCLGEGYWLAGAYDQARQTLTGVLDTAQRCGMQFVLGSAYRLLGEVTLHTSPAEAPSHFETSIAILHAIHAENELALAYAGYGRLHAKQGDMTQARDYLTRALAIFERLGTLGEPDKVRQVLTTLPQE